MDANVVVKRVDVGDVELHVTEAGSGPVLLLAHGFPLDHTMWRGQFEGLADCCRVIAPDLRGFGRSDVISGRVTMEQLADDLAALLDSLRITEPVNLCGLSMGGYIAWQFWRRHAQRLSRLILCDTRAAADTEEAARMRLKSAEMVLSQGPRAVVEAMMPKLLSPSTVQNQPEVAESLRQTMLAAEPAAIAAVQRGMAQRKDFRGMLGQMHLPVLLICGHDDAISPPAEMQEIAAAIPDCQFVEIDRAGHMAPTEQPAAVNRAIRKFLGV